MLHRGRLRPGAPVVMGRSTSRGGPPRRPTAARRAWSQQEGRFRKECGLGSTSRLQSRLRQRGHPQEPPGEDRLVRLQGQAAEHHQEGEPT